MIKKLLILSLAFMVININGASDAKKKKINIPESIIRYIKSISDMQQDIGLNIELAGVPAELLSDRAFNNIVSILLQIKVADPNKLTDKEIVEIWDLIKSKRCNLKDLVDMILKIDYLDISVLRRPMLLTALEIFVTMFENNSNRAAIEQLKRLPKNISNELKYLYFDQYPMPIFHHYAHVEKDLDLQLHGCNSVFFAPNKELLVTWNKDKIMVIDPMADNIIVQIPSMNSDFKDVMVNNNYIVGTTRTNNLFIWDIKTGYIIKHMPGITADLKYIDDKCFCFADSALLQIPQMPPLLPMTMQNTHFYKFEDLNQEWLSFNLPVFNALIFTVDENLGAELFYIYSGLYDMQGIRQNMPIMGQSRSGIFPNDSYDNSIMGICPKLYPRDFILKYLIFQNNVGLYLEQICSDKECNMRVKDKHIHVGLGNELLFCFDKISINNIRRLKIKYCRDEFSLEINQEYLFRIFRNIYNQDLIDIMQKIYPEQPSSCSIM